MAALPDDGRRADAGTRRSRRRRLFSWLAALLPLSALGAAAWLATRARYVPPDPPVDLAPPAVAKAEKRVEAATRELRKARRDAAAGKARPYRIEVRQDDLNTLLSTDARAALLLRRHRVTRPALQIKDGRLKAGALVTYRGQRVYVTAEGPVTPG